MAIELQNTAREALERFRETYPELGSVGAIAAQSEADFIHTHLSKFEGGSREARQVYRLAVNLKRQADLLWLNIRDILSPYFQQTLFNNLPTQLPDSFLEQQAKIPAYERLFGELNRVESDHCRSIFGPAAYFVDLLRFIEANITRKSAFNTIPIECQLDYRRPDLSRIRLDCDSANELISYVELVNELLEVFIKTIETVDQEAYEILKDEVFPMHLPYHLPLDEIRSYLKQLKTSLYHIYQAFERSQDNGIRARITGEALDLSPEELSLIVSELAAPLSVYGNVPLTGEQGLENVDVFLEQTQLTRQELNHLMFQDLDRHEINAGLSRLFFINTVEDGLGYLTLVPADGKTSPHSYDKLLNLSLAKLDRIYRFLKLSRKLGWSFADLDWALRSLHAPYIPETALWFDGINDYVECQNVTQLDLGTFTIEAWINPADAGRNIIISKGSAVENALHWMMWVNSDSHLAFYGRYSDTEDLEVESVVAIPSGVFTHVAVVVDDRAKTLKLFINGTLVQLFVNGDREVAVAVANLAARIAPIGTDLNIGRDLYDEYFSGVIKEVRIWSSARSPEAIHDYRYRRLTGQEAGLVAYWTLTETPANSLLDLTANGNHGVMGGMQFSTQPRWVHRDLVLDPLVVGQGLRFNGIDDYLAANAVSYGDLKEITVEAWIRLEARSEKNTLVFKGNRATGRSQFTLWVNAEGKLVFESASLAKPYISDRPILIGQLTHIAVSLDQEEGSNWQILKIYLNGILDLQEIVTPAAANIMPLAAQEGGDVNGEPLSRADSYLWVGRGVEGGYFNGVIRELRLWNRPRTEEQIALYLYRPVSMGEPGLIGYWRLDAIESRAIEGRATEGRVADQVAPDLAPGSRHPLFLGGIAADHAPDRITLAERLLPPLPIAVSGTVLQFDGDNDVVVIHEANQTTLRHSKRWGLGQYERLTLEFWFNPLDSTLGDRQQVLFSQGDAEAGLSVYLFQHQLHILAWCNNFEGTALQQSLLKSQPIDYQLDYQQWHHLAITHNEFPHPTANAPLLPLEPIELKGYLNGRPLETPTGATTALGYRLSPVGVAYLGGIGKTGVTKFETGYSIYEAEHHYFFAGQMTDLRLWKIAKTAAEIERDRHVAPATTSPDLVSYFPTTEGQGNQIKDCAGDGTNPDVGTLQARNIAFVTDGNGIELENTFSHYHAPDALTWSNYVYTGRLYIDSEDAGIGVTFLSQYPNNEARFYRLQRHRQMPQFHLVAHTHGFQPLTFRRNAGITPQPNTWYRFRIRVEEINNQTEIRVLVWEDELDTVEPPADAFQIVAIDSSVYRLTQGTVGVWAFGAGKKQFDQLRVERIAPLGTSGEILLSDNSFEPVIPPQDPTRWNHTSDRMLFRHNALLFKTVVLEENHVFGTDQTLEQMHSFYNEPEALNWTNYVYTGQIRFTDADSGAGVTVFSRYPEARDQHYQLGRDRLQSTFHLDARPYGIQPLQGMLDSGVESRPDVWYRFRIEVRSDDTATTLKAKVWQAGTNEPDTFQIEAIDDSDIRLQSGTVGVWAGDRGSKFFDQLQVVALPDVRLEENFAQYAPGQDPDQWVDTGTRINFDDPTPISQVIADPTTAPNPANNRVLSFPDMGDRELSSVYSHYVNPTENPAVLTWSDYTYSGRFYLADLNGSIGVTVLSQFPNRQERCYRLGYEGDSAHFRVVGVIPGEVQPLSGTGDSAVVAQANTWYRFQIKVENDEAGDRTLIRAKIWPSGTEAPQTFQINAVDAGEQRLKAGTVGIWAADLGIKLFDDLRVQRGILYSANFETATIGQIPTDWRLTSGEPERFSRLLKVADVENNRVFALEQSGPKAIHAHYTLPAALDWSHYTYTGRFLITPPADVRNGKAIAQGGIGVTYFSRQTLDASPRVRDRFYHLRAAAHPQQKTFIIRAEPGIIKDNPEQQNSGVIVEANTWYRFQIEVHNTAARTEVRAKIWKQSDPMPDAFQMEGYDDAMPNQANNVLGRLTSGTIGVWAEGNGTKYFDDLQVSEGMILFEDFATLTVNQHPTHWVDTPIQHHVEPQPGLFKTVDVDGKTVLGTALRKYSAHSHYHGSDVEADGSDYTCVGKLRLTDASGGIGVTVLSGYAQNQDQYYRLSYGKSGFTTFHLVAHPHNANRLKGEIDSGITPQLNVWYRFRIAVQDGGDRTILKAKIWQDGQDEPTADQIDAYDDTASRLTSGTVGVWAAGQGNQYFDEIAVFRRIVLSEDFGGDAPDSQPPQWTSVSARRLFEPDLDLFATLDISDNSLHWAVVDNYPLLLRPLSRRALQFNGWGEYVAGATRQPLELTQFTIAAWVNLAAPRNSQIEQDNPILAMGGFTPSGEAMKLWFGVTVGPDNQQHFKLSLLHVQDQIRLIDASHAIPLGQYVYVAVQVDGDRVTFYLAGETEFASEANIRRLQTPLALRVTHLEIGKDLGTQYFAGQIKEVRLWNVARRLDVSIAEQYQRPPVSLELVGYWTFDEATGNEARDTSISGNSLWLGDEIGSRQPDLVDLAEPDRGFWRSQRQVLGFNGTSQLIPISDEGNGTTRLRRTIEVWFRAEDKGISDRKQVIYHEGDDQRGLTLYIFDGSLYFGGYNLPPDESGWQGTWIRTDRIQSGKWHHAALVLDGRAEIRPESLRAFLDGRLIDASPGSQLWGDRPLPTLGGVSGRVRFHDGISTNLTGHYFWGQILELRLWNTARTTAQIAATRMVELQGDEPFLALWWVFDDITDNQIRDMSGNRRTAIAEPGQLQPIMLLQRPTLPRLRLDTTTLDQLATIKQLKDQSHLSIDRLAALWYRVKHFGRDDKTTLFDQVFNPKGVVGDAWQAYPMLRWGKLGQENPNRDRQIRTRLMGALQISDADLDAIVTALSGTDPVIDLDHLYLNRLYRLARLSRLLRLSVKDLLRLLDFMQIGAIAALSDVVQLVERADWLKLTGLSVADLEFFASPVEASRLLTLSDSAVRDVADRLIRQSRDFLVGADSFISNEINQAQSIALFHALVAQGTLSEATPNSTANFVDGKRAVTAHYSGLEQLNRLTFSDPGLKATLQPHWQQVDSLLTRLRDEHRNAILVELATLFGTSPDVLQVVFKEYESIMEPIQFLSEMQRLQVAGSPPSTDLILYLNTLAKVLSLVSRFELTAVELAVLFDHPDYFSVKSVLQPAIADLNSLYQFKTFKTIYNDSEGKLLAVLQTTTAPAAEQAIATLTGWDVGQLARLQVYFGANRLYHRLGDLELLQRGLALAETLKVDVDFLIQLASSHHTFEGYQQLAAATLKVLRAHYTDEAWAEVYPPIRDRLAVNRRDALLSLALLKLPDGVDGQRDVDLLYEYFLLDPQVGSDVQTSRLVQATASLQLYIQRCLMNLEKGVDPASIPLKEWEWMKNYRVWEANRKVFLYPENYIEPELRDTKTPLFAELEQELLQSDINQRSVERAYTNYLDKFAELASLRIVGSYLRQISDNEAIANAALPDKILYLIGRTDTQPRIYYYRELHLTHNRPQHWLPWHKIDLTINADNVTPVYAFDRLFLFWAEITKTTESYEVNGEQHSRDVYQPTVKYSYYNFSEAWVQPQTYLEEPRRFDHGTIQQAKWQRVNVQRSLELVIPEDSQPNTRTLNNVSVLKVAQIQQNGQWIARFAIEREVYNINAADSTWSIWAKFVDENVVTLEPQSATLDVFNYNNGQLLVSVLAQQIVHPSINSDAGVRDAETSVINNLNSVFIYTRLVFKSYAIAIEKVSNTRTINDVIASNAVTNLENDTNELKRHLSALQSTLDRNRSVLGDSRTDELKEAERAINALSDEMKGVVQRLNIALISPGSVKNGILAELRVTETARAQYLLDAQAQPVKAQFYWGSPILTLIVKMGDRLVHEESLEYSQWNKWHNLVLTLHRQPDNYNVRFYLTDGSTQPRSTINVTVSSPPLNNGSLKVGKPTAVTSTTANSHELITAHLSEFQLWNYGRDEQTIRQKTGERLDGSEVGLALHLPLNTNGGDASLTIEPSELDLWQANFGLLPVTNQERMIVFYGDTVGALRDNLDDLSLKLTLEPRNTQPHYDVTITQSRLYLSTTQGLSINDFAIASDVQSQSVYVEILGKWYNLRDYNPDYLRSLVDEYKRVYPNASAPAVLQTVIPVIERYLHETNDPNTTLLSNLPAFEATVFDVNNQPGWYIVNAKTDQFLLMAEQPTKTVEERLKFEYGITQSRSVPQPITLYFDHDPALEVNLASPANLKFRVERLSTYALHELSQNLFKGGLDALISRQSQRAKEWDFGSYNPSNLVIPPSSYRAGVAETIDFNGAYGVYYWEIFFHIPFLIANRLNANQSFADAQRWYHYIFDPTTREAAHVAQNSGDRYWQFEPFRNLQSQSLAHLLTNPSSLSDYRNDPFDPHAIARLRLVAYQKAIVMKYIDNLLDWGDALFTRDTRESVNEATLLYILAANLLGQRPQSKTVKELREVGTYADFLREHEAFVQANANLIQQDAFDFEFWSDHERSLFSQNGSSPHSHLITSFSVPENATFIGYWDRVEDRLYKIRHSLNIEGVLRQQSLFDPPIDPMVLVRAVAGGRDLGSVLNEVSLPVPHYRYSYFLDKTKEMVSFVIDLGSALLGAIENREAAQLELMLNTHEQAILDLTTQVKRWEIDGAQQHIQQLQINQQRLQAKKDRFEKLISDNLSHEENAYLSLKGLAQGSRSVAVGAEIVSASSFAVPDIIVGGAGVGGSPVSLALTGGKAAGEISGAIAAQAKELAEIFDTAADMTGKIGEHKRRKGEWEHEKKVAESELNEIGVQLAIAQTALKKAQRELLLHQKAITHSQEVADFHRRKFSNQDLYHWMIGRLSSLYFQSYKLAYDMAKSTEKALQFELPTTDTFISFGHWDSLKKGLLAGESLMLELHRMSKIRLDRDSRFLEMEKIISLKLSPNLGGELQTQMEGKLDRLKQEGVCEFELSERLFNEDFPGHYCRLIKNIAISIRFSSDGLSEVERRELELRSLNATVVQHGNKTLLQPSIDAVRYLMNSDGEQPDTGVLRVDWRSNQQIAISRANEESSGAYGSFDLNLLLDDRYFPFEGTGAVSSWRLELPQTTPNGFPLDKIDDVVIRLRYTAKSDNGKFKTDVQSALTAEPSESID